MSSRHTMDDHVDACTLDRISHPIVGSALDRPDGPLKVTGAATYAHEWDVPDSAIGVLVRSTVAKGRLVDLNEGSVETLPGVLGVFSDHRFLRNPAQGTAEKAPAQGVDEISYVGQPIALVVGESLACARHAAAALVPRYETATPTVDPEADGVPTERPEDSQLEQGDLDAAMRDAAFTVDAIYRTAGHSSAAMEPHCSIASWEGEQLTLRGSYQMLKYNREQLADALGIDPANVRIIAPYVGGGFGSKLGIAPEAVAAAVAARALGRPVRVEMTRQQTFEMVMRRSETRQRVRLAADERGVVVGIGHDSLVSNLPGEDFFEPVDQATHFLYPGAHRRIGIEVARLDRTCAGSVRAPGEAVGVQAIEIAMDELAVASGIDPVELRRRNIPERHPEEDTPYSSRRIREALDEGARRFGWDRRIATPGRTRSGEWLIGMGMASGARVNMISEAKARVVLRPSGTVLVQTDMTDIGTGTYAILSQIASDMLGVSTDDVTVELGDTDLPPGSGSGGSMGAASTGSAVYLACQQIRERLAEHVECDESELVLSDGCVRTDSRQSWLRDVLGGRSITATGHLQPGTASDAVHQATYGAYFAEVGVNIVTGETRVRRMLGVFGAGRILNHKTATSQCSGAMVWGIGMALTEGLQVDPRDGHIVNRDLADYHIPVNLDVPRIEVVLLDERDGWASPIHAKGIGELGVCGSSAAVLNAIYNATGVRVRNCPATLDTVLGGLPDVFTD